MENKTALQCFEWYLPADGGHWRHVAQNATQLCETGFTTIWLPPAYKGAAGSSDVGYGVYDLYDLGEFDQKGAVHTKYGTKEEYLTAIRALQAAGLEVLADIVLNHRIGADECEQVNASICAQGDRNQESPRLESVTVWTKFTFPGRGGAYSDFTWNFSHFDGVDWDDRRKLSAIFQFEHKHWDTHVDNENGNYDYLMGADLDMSNPEVEAELIRWGRWYLETTGVDGFRLDAVKHISYTFFIRWLKALRSTSSSPLFAVGEYWKPQAGALTSYLDHCGHVMSLFDVALHFNLHNASYSGGHYNMQQIFDQTLTQARPALSMTFVDNHDTQPGQALESWVMQWFKPLAYALILLRDAGFPCVFYGDLYGIPHSNIPPVGPVLAVLLRARRHCAYGIQTDYFDHHSIVGWARGGDSLHPYSGMAVLLSDGEGGSKAMCVGAAFAGMPFYDCTGNRTEQIIIEENGMACFAVNGGSVSVWVPQQAKQYFPPA